MARSGKIRISSVWYGTVTIEVTLLSNLYLCVGHRESFLNFDFVRHFFTLIHYNPFLS